MSQRERESEGGSQTPESNKYIASHTPKPFFRMSKATSPAKSSKGHFISSGVFLLVENHHSVGQDQ